MKCDVCGKEFRPGNREDGTPNGVTFLLQNDVSLTMCADCIIKKGREVAKEQKKNGN